MDKVSLQPRRTIEWFNNSLGERPQEAQSAGLSSVGTWGHVDGGKFVRMVDNLLPTKVLKRFELPSNHQSTIVLSHHAWT